jgi:DNA-binding CsgD family transcriptional regulator
MVDSSFFRDRDAPIPGFGTSSSDRESGCVGIGRHADNSVTASTSGHVRLSGPRRTPDAIGASAGTELVPLTRRRQQAGLDMTEELALTLGEIAATTEPLSSRAEALLVELGRTIPFDSAWMALADPLGTGYSSLASTALDESTVRYLSGPVMAHDIEVTGTDRVRPPLSPSDLPFPAEVLPTWAECLMPAGYHEALAVSLFGPGHRQIGFLALLSGHTRPPSEEVRSRLDALTPILAEGIDPMRSVLLLARLVQHAVAGVMLMRRHDVVRLPGFVDDALLARDSQLLDVARRALRGGRTHASFLWPSGESRANHRHVRVTTLTCPDDLGTGFAGIVLLSPTGPVQGLTARELEVLGLIIEGYSNQEIAHELVVAPRTVATHVEHILVKLDAPSRTVAAVRAERTGLYVPSRSQS